jgi:hypothetical protein
MRNFYNSTVGDVFVSDCWLIAGSSNAGIILDGRQFRRQGQRLSAISSNDAKLGHCAQIYYKW